MFIVNEITLHAIGYLSFFLSALGSPVHNRNLAPVITAMKAAMKTRTIGGMNGRMFASHNPYTWKIYY